MGRVVRIAIKANLLPWRKRHPWSSMSVSHMAHAYTVPSKRTVRSIHPKKWVKVKGSMNTTPCPYGRSLYNLIWLIAEVTLCTGGLTCNRLSLSTSFSLALSLSRQPIPSTRLLIPSGRCLSVQISMKRTTRWHACVYSENHHLTNHQRPEDRTGDPFTPWYMKVFAPNKPNKVLRLL